MIRALTVIAAEAAAQGGLFLLRRKYRLKDEAAERHRSRPWAV
jgi:hypothetical protein